MQAYRINKYDVEHLQISRLNAVIKEDNKEIIRNYPLKAITVEEYLSYKKTRKAKLVIYTAISGGYDDLIQHCHISKDFDYVCFTDQVIEDPGIWEIKSLKEQGYDHTRSARYYKLHPHLLFPDYEYSIWIDGNIDLLNSELEMRLLELIEQGKTLSVNVHFKRICIYQEANACLLYNLDNPEIINNQMEHYSNMGFPRDFGLFETNIIFRKNHESDNVKLMQDWWSEITRFSKRDQLSFNYVLWKNNILCEPMFLESHRNKLGFEFRLHQRVVNSVLYIDRGEGFVNKDFIVKRVILNSDGKYSVNFNLKDYKGICALLFKPTLGISCILRIEQIKLDRVEAINIFNHTDLLKLLKHNGIKNKRGELLFYNIESEIIIPVGGDIESLSIEGELKLIDEGPLVMKNIENTIYRLYWKHIKSSQGLKRLVFLFKTLYKNIVKIFKNNL